MTLNRDPLFPHLCPGYLGNAPEEGCAVCLWLCEQEQRDQFYRERHGEKERESD